MAYMFESVLSRIPKNRSELVNDLEIPEEITTQTSFDSQEWSDPDISLTTSDSLFSETLEELVGKPKRPTTASTDSSLPLSRAMTDSEIDYGMFRKIRDRRLSDPWAEMKARLDAFPPGYLASMESFMCSSTSTLSSCSEPLERPRPPSPLRNEELHRRMERFFDEISVFTPDDPSLGELQEAISKVDLAILESDLDTIVTYPTDL